MNKLCYIDIHNTCFLWQNDNYKTHGGVLILTYD